MSAFYLMKGKRVNEYYFNLTGGNNEVILTSEMYTSKSGAQKSIQSVRANSPIDARYERKTASNNQFYFVLKGGNGEIIGRSELYVSRYGMNNGIEAVKTIGPTAQIINQTLEWNG